MGKLLKGIGIIIVLFFIIGLFGSSGSKKGSTGEQTREAAVSEEKEEAPSSTVKEEPTKEVKEETTPISNGPQFEGTLGEQNAFKQAQSYLTYSAFSYKGLIDQLSSEYGSGYSLEESTKAVDFMVNNGMVDWKEQAIKQAESYLEYSAFSRAGLINQLSSEHGAQFTAEEAEYAVKYLEDNSMVDWNEQAVKQAESYLEYSSFSREGLIDQLSSEYGSQFTKEQAEYAVQAIGY